jgi:hypothetical protein
MLNRVVRWMLVLVVGLAVSAGTARAQMPLLLPRPGQIGFSLQGQYGTLLSSGKMGDEFGSGGGLALRLRYRMRYERALGLSFESQKLDSRAAADTFTTVSLLLSGVDFYQFFNTDQKLQQMISLGGGIVQVHYTRNDGETEYPLSGDGLYLSLGAGLERFFYRSFAFDLSSRYIAIFHDSAVNHDLQASVGVIFYASY